MKNKNLAYNGLNFVIGFGIAALFLAKLIPDLQYWYTRKTTGRNEFPGTCDYSKPSATKTAGVNKQPAPKTIAQA